jgi:hypothetical protein
VAGVGWGRLANRTTNNTQGRSCPRRGAPLERNCPKGKELGKDTRGTRSREVVPTFSGEQRTTLRPVTRDGVGRDWTSGIGSLVRRTGYQAQGLDLVRLQR